MAPSVVLMRAALLGAATACVLGGGMRADGQDRKRGRGGDDAAVVRGTLAAVDAGRGTVTVTVHTFNRATREATDTDKTFPLATGAKVTQDAAPAKLGDLKKGYPVTVRLDGASAAGVSVDGGTAEGEFVSANPDRGTVTVLAGRNQERRVYHLLKTTTVTGRDGAGAAVTGLKAGAVLSMTLSVEDDRTVVHIRALPAAGK